jgi:hypothetical protein
MSLDIPFVESARLTHSSLGLIGDQWRRAQVFGEMVVRDVGDAGYEFGSKTSRLSPISSTLGVPDSRTSG